MELQKNKNIVRTFDGIVLVAKSKPRFHAQMITEKVILPQAETSGNPVAYSNDQASGYEAALPLKLETEAQQTVTDNRKRMFLRLAGIAGIGSIAAMLLPKKAQAYVLGGSPTSGVVGVKDSSNNRINPAKEDGNLASINTQAQKLTFDGDSNLYVQAAPNFSSQLENASSVVINPATEDSLSTVKTQLNKLTFDGSSNLLTATSGAASTVGLKDTTSTQINPATDDGITYLRRIVKLMESQAVVDNANRQRITIDSLGTGTAVTTTIPVSGSLTSAGTVSTVTNMTTLAGQNQQMYQDVARTAYATGIRQNLAFS
jgi:hypothetical protein